MSISRGLFPAGNTLGSKPYSLKDFYGMKQSNQDYFNLKPTRGSSPTVSLAADLSQNFHIDQR